jgi:hypothetical protein
MFHRHFFLFTDKERSYCNECSWTTC